MNWKFRSHVFVAIREKLTGKIRYSILNLVNYYVTDSKQSHKICYHS